VSVRGLGSSCTGGPHAHAQHTSACPLLAGCNPPVRGHAPGPPHAAGVDIGAQEIVACVPDGEDQQIVRTFGTDTAALQTLADWCVDCGLQTVAMASTGVYGLPLCEALEARGLPCCLSSAPSMQRVPGRQSDVLDGQWIHT
jgi:hypothetical protein